MSLPTHHLLSPTRPATLAQAVDQARFPRNHATARLTPHREELLRLRQAGESVETLTAGLRLIGIEIGRETMRRWLQRELGQKPARRRTPHRQLAAAPVAGPLVREVAPERPVKPIAATFAVHPAPAADSAPPGVPEQSSPVRPSSFILPGETPEQALRRRLAVLDAQKAAARNTGAATVSGQATTISTPPA